MVPATATSPPEHSLAEQVVEFEPATAITFRITESTLPFKTADIAFTLTDGGQQARTELTVSPTYTLKYGPLGRILDTVAVRRTYRAGMRELLEGLKRHVERNNRTADRITSAAVAKAAGGEAVGNVQPFSTRKTPMLQTSSGVRSA